MLRLHPREEMCDEVEAVAVEDTALDVLEREGLVKRLSSDEDRRASIIKITPKGESVLAEMRELTSKARKDFLGDISVDEVRRMLDMLEHMLSFLKD